MTLDVAVIGAGPRGIQVLERIGANAPELIGEAALTVHLVDPHPPGGGRVWRTDQSALLWLNSMAEDVTMFVDESVVCDGPNRPGPSLAEWAVGAADTDAGDLIDELRALTPTSFPTRRLGNAYLSWCYRHVVASLPPAVSVRIHAAAAVDITEVDGRQRVHLTGGDTVDADAVVLTLGHLDTEPSGDAAELAAEAHRQHLTYVPPAYSADVDLSALRPDQDVIVRGLGLAFIDVLVLLTEGRGGRFDGSRYVPSGLEPRLHVGSRRGVPYHTKLTYRPLGPPPPLPRFFTADAVAELVRGEIGFRQHVWPILAKEVAWAGYHELFHGHPARVSMSWTEFDAAYAPLTWAAPAMTDLIARAVPDREDRVDFERLDRPLAGLRFDSAAAVHDAVCAHVRADLHRRTDPTYSVDLGVFAGLLSLFALLPSVLGAPTMSARSVSEDFDGWWFGFFNSVASGPPPQRVGHLLALADAGVVHFVGPDMWVDVAEGRFRAGSSAHPDVVEGDALVDAILPLPAVMHSRDSLVRTLVGRGELVELVRRERDGTAFRTGQIQVNPHNGALAGPHPHRFALGPHTNAKAPAFARPHTNAPALRANDACARALLHGIVANRPMLAHQGGR